MVYNPGLCIEGGVIEKMTSFTAAGARPTTLHSGFTKITPGSAIGSGCKSTTSPTRDGAS
ncbi:hypothetical protein QJS10_CPB12g00694 [Acorus calamus]|uniref:Uncharacterized protein n=1 Tax=Acorus calamus TaxID=4465 RepID=A0AAV9DNK7_ACOCL|nr:hypothetical protein QJS10_CPB12g00694 [Acorus calamus]